MTAETKSGSTPLLLRALRLNVGFSLLSGGTLIIGAPWLDGLLGPPSWILAAVGVGVAGFGLSLWRGLDDDPFKTGRLAVLADVSWVIATVGLGPFVGESFTSLGGRMAIAVAVVVADLALLEWLGLRRFSA